MIYLASRLHRSTPIAIEQLTEDWRQLAQEIEQIGFTRWRVRQVIEVLPRETIFSPCYLWVEQSNHGTIFTMIASQKEAMESVRSLIENIYAPVEPASLNDFIEQNQELHVHTAWLFDHNNEDVNKWTFEHPVVLSDLLKSESTEELLSLSAYVNMETPSLCVRKLYVSFMNNLIEFSVETNLQEDLLINTLFPLADRTFAGTQRISG